MSTSANKTDEFKPVVGATRQVALSDLFCFPRLIRRGVPELSWTLLVPYCTAPLSWAGFVLKLILTIVATFYCDWLCFWHGSSLLDCYKGSLDSPCLPAAISPVPFLPFFFQLILSGSGILEILRTPLFAVSNCDSHPDGWDILLEWAWRPWGSKARVVKNVDQAEGHALG